MSTDYEPTDEMVEAADAAEDAYMASIEAQQRDGEHVEGDSEDRLTAVLTAVGPLIAAQAWDEGYTRGFYAAQVLPSGADASEGAGENPYEEGRA